MRKVLFFGFLLLLSSCSKDEVIENRVEGTTVWSKTLGGSLDDATTGVVGTSDGGLIVVGYSKSSDGDVNKIYSSNDIWLTKLDVNGDVVWNKTLGGSDDDYAINIIKTSDSNYVVAGYSGSSDFDVPRNLGMHDFFIFKMNENGAIIWSKVYGFSSHDHAHKIIQTRDGGFFVAGYADYAGIDGQPGNGEGHEMDRNSNTVQHGVGEFFGIKLNALGEFQWYRYYGGTQNDRVNDIIEANDGGIVMVGYSESNDFDVVGAKGSYDYWVIKIDASGHLHWKKNYGGSDIDQAYGIAKTDHNSYLIVGQSNSTDGDVTNPKGNSDVWVIHIDDHGHLIWDKSFGGSQFETGYAIKKSSNNQYVVLGHSRSNDNQIINKGQNDVYLLGFDTQPNSGVLWQKTFGGSSFDFGYDLAQMLDGSWALVGLTQSNDGDFTLNKGMNDRFIVKMK
jgi:hypothetical protein